MDNLKVQKIDGGVVFRAKIVPGSSKTAVCGLLDGMLKVKVSAAPEKGKANQCLVNLLAKELGLKRNAVTITSGRTNPLKVVQVLGISRETLFERLNVNKEGPSNER